MTSIMRFHLMWQGTWVAIKALPFLAFSGPFWMIQPFLDGSKGPGGVHLTACGRVKKQYAPAPLRPLQVCKEAYQKNITPKSPTKVHSPERIYQKLTQGHLRETVSVGATRSGAQDAALLSAPPVPAKLGDSRSATGPNAEPGAQSKPPKPSRLAWHELQLGASQKVILDFGPPSFAILEALPISIAFATRASQWKQVPHDGNAPLKSSWPKDIRNQEVDDVAPRLCLEL